MTRHPPGHPPGPHLLRHLVAFATALLLLQHPGGAHGSLDAEAHEEGEDAEGEPKGSARRGPARPWETMGTHGKRHGFHLGKPWVSPGEMEVMTRR